MIDWYHCRWEIEILFHVFKNGCRVEALKLGSMAKLELALAVYLVVSWSWHLTRLAGETVLCQNRMDRRLYSQQEEATNRS